MLIEVMPDEDGFHWRGVRPEDQAIVKEIMLAGFVGSPASWASRPHTGSLGGFCAAAVRKGYQVLVKDGEV